MGGVVETCLDKAGNHKTLPPCVSSESTNRCRLAPPPLFELLIDQNYNPFNYTAKQNY